MDGKDAFSFAKTRGSGRKSRAASHAGCSFNIVFFEDFKIYSGLWPLSVPLGVSVCTQWQVKHRRRSRTCRVKKNHYISRKNTIINEHPVHKNDAYRPSLLSPTHQGTGAKVSPMQDKLFYSIYWVFGR